MSDTASQTGSSASPPAESFLFLYFSQLVGIPVLHETSGDQLGRVYDFVAQSTTPYPTVCGVQIRSSAGLRQVPWSAVRHLSSKAMYLSPDDDSPVPTADYSVRHDLIRKLAVEVSATSVVRIWDVHFVYSEGKMVLAHAEIGIRGLLRTLRLEKLTLRLLGSILATALRERFATFRHLQIMKAQPDGSIYITKRVLEMHPADLASVLRQLPDRFRRYVFRELSVEAAAAVLREAETRFQRRFLAACPRERRKTVQKLMAAIREAPPL